uniref:Putative secreted protein n=1 Tax=Anopheles triannulatus TaxID=58253 RepID=A0A2M4B0X6_9DIPT
MVFACGVVLLRTPSPTCCGVDPRRTPRAACTGGSLCAQTRADCRSVAGPGSCRPSVTHGYRCPACGIASSDGRKVRADRETRPR